MTWPLEMSRLILEYAGYIQTAAQIARDEAIEYEARQDMVTVIAHLRNIGTVRANRSEISVQPSDLRDPDASDTYHHIAFWQ